MNGPTIHRTSPQIAQPATISSTSSSTRASQAEETPHSKLTQESYTRWSRPLRRAAMRPSRTSARRT